MRLPVKLAVFCLALVFFPAISAVAAGESPLSIRGPFFALQKVAPGEPVSIRFDVASSQTSEIFTVAQGVLIDGSGSRVTQLEEGLRRKLRLFGGRTRSIEFKIRVPSSERPESYRVCLDLLPVQPGAPAYISSSAAPTASANDFFEISGGGSTVGRDNSASGSGGGGWEQIGSSPDLKIERVRLAQSRVAPGQPLQVQVALANIGVGDAGSCDVVLSFDDLSMLALTTRCDSLPVGGRKTLELSVTPDTRLVRAGAHSLKITADHAWELDELDRTNNLAEVSFQELHEPVGIIFDREEILLQATAGQQEPARGFLTLWSRDGASVEVTSDLKMDGLKCAPARLIVDQNQRKIEIGAPAEILKTGVPGSGARRGTLTLRAKAVEGDDERTYEVPVRLDVAQESQPPRLKILTPAIRGEANGNLKVILPYEAINLREPDHPAADVKLVAQISLDGGGSVHDLVVSSSSQGAVEVTVPEDFRGAKALFILSVAGSPAIKDITKTALNLEGGKIVLTSPLAGATVARGEEIPIQWNVSGGVDFIRCDYRMEGEQQWAPIISAVPASAGRITWRVPDDLEEPLCRIRVAEVGNERVAAEITQPIRIEEPALTLATTADIAVEALAAIPQEATVGIESIRLSGRVTNMGGATSGVYGMRIFVDDQEIRNLSFPRPPLAAKSSGNFSLQLPVQLLRLGVNRVKATVDAGFSSNAALGIVTVGRDNPASKMRRLDFDESNNEAIVEIRRAAPQPGDSPSGIGRDNPAPLPDPHVDPVRSPADLVIRDFVAEPAEPQEGDMIHLKARYGNIGGSDVRHAYVVFREGNRTLDELTAPTEEHPAPAGSWMTATANFRPSSSGFKTLRAEMIIPESVHDSNLANNSREIKIEVRPNPEKALREIIKSMADVYQKGDLDRFISFYSPQFSAGAGGNLQEYRSRLKEMRSLRDDLDLAIEIDVESVDEKDNHTATVTYALAETIRWKDGWDDAILKRQKLRDNFVFQNNRWLCAKREILE